MIFVAYTSLELGENIVELLWNIFYTILVEQLDPRLAIVIGQS